MVDKFLGEMTIQRCRKLEHVFGRHPSGGQSKKTTRVTHKNKQGVLLHDFDFFVSLLCNAFTDLVLHRSDSAIRHPVHLIGQLYGHQPPTGSNRSAVRRQLRHHVRLGLGAALVPQVLRTEKTQGRLTNEGKRGSTVSKQGAMNCFYAREGEKRGRAVNRVRLLCSPLNRVASIRQVDTLLVSQHLTTYVRQTEPT